ncbi:ABC transporter ATP-binding protein [Clostridium sp. 19966]|uniref:ABC transporter ATP-binding protein n=1 Tax=Clostridium sp. 19966 TaxID=2768166 RepID=UPI0028E07BD1|nr:ABC transporter ATP-binding protein [Clostridium sp. 19966]MDT8718971.1 ABC transporter ATP-binding protein [Clostridium sp. 19966]
MDIHLKNLSMKFSDALAINDISLTVKSGELVSLLGPSGCGKSTTLSMIAGLNRPTSGDIYFGDDCVTDEEPEDREIGMVFQNYALYPHMTVLKNIMFPLKMKKVDKKEAIKMAQDMAEIVQVDKMLDRKPKQLSGGQQQRVAIARALVKKPKVLLLDEPLSNLDARLRIEMREEIRRIQMQTGVTTIFVTHDQEEAMSISDRIIVMNKGEIQQYSTAQELYNKPENLFVAQFIGNPKINTIDVGKINNKELVVGIRAEDVKINSSQQTIFTGKVKYIERLGKDVLVKIDCQGNDIAAFSDKTSNIALNDQVNVSFDERSIHWFDKESEKRIEPEKDWYENLLRNFNGGSK